MGSPSTFLPRTLFSDEESDTDICSSGDHQPATSRSTDAHQASMLYPLDSFSSDDEVGPLEWSGFHDQIEALLRTVQKPAGYSSQSAYDMPSDDLKEGHSSSDASSRCDDSGASKEEDGGVQTDSGKAKRSIHSDTYGQALPTWLIGSKATSGSMQQDSTVMTAVVPVGDFAMRSRGQPSTMGIATPGHGDRQLLPRKPLPEWLISPAKPGAGMTGAATRAACRSPFKPLIEEIEAHFAAVDANRQSTAYTYENFTQKSMLEGVRWYTSEVAKATAEVDLHGSAENLMPDGEVRARPAAAASISNSSPHASKMCGLDNMSRLHTPAAVQQDQVVGEGPSADAKDAAEPRRTDAAEHSLKVFGFPWIVEEIASSQATPEIEMAALSHKVPASPGLADGAATPDTLSPAPRPQGSRVQDYRIVRPTVSPQTVMRTLACEDVMSMQPASQDKGNLLVEDGRPVSCAVHAAAAGNPPWSTDGKRRILGELPVWAVQNAAQEAFISNLIRLPEDDPTESGIVQTPSSNIQAFNDGTAVLEGKVVRPDTEQLRAVYAKVDALSHDILGTQDELEQLRSAEAHLKEMYEGLAGHHALEASSQPVPPIFVRPDTAPEQHAQTLQLNALEAARKELACRLEVQTAELSEKDARLSHITALLDHAREVLAAKQREVDVLLGESIGLQDVLVDCGEEAAARAVHLAELEAQLASSTARVQEIEGQLAQREAELQSCRAQLADTERLLEAAMHLPAAITAETALAAEPTAPGMVKPSDSSSGEEAVASEQKERPTSAELLQRAMVTPPLAERRAFRREASVGLTPESNTPSLSTDRQAWSFRQPKTPSWAAGTPSLRAPNQVLAAHRPGPGAARSAWDVPSPSPMAFPSASTEALATVLATIRKEEQRLVGSEGETDSDLPETPLAAVLRRINTPAPGTTAAAY